MSDLERLLRATRACVHEGVRRDLGDQPDVRFDVPLAMLLDLSDEMEERDAHAVDVLVEELHAERYPGEDEGATASESSPSGAAA